MHAQLPLQCWNYANVTVLLGGDQYSCTIHHIIYHSIHAHEVQCRCRCDLLF